LQHAKLELQSRWRKNCHYSFISKVGFK